MGEMLGRCSVSGACAGMTLLAGVAHVAQGLRDPAGCREMNLPPWFMTCAGLWMVGSGASFFYDEYLGFLFMASSMGGAAATAALSPAKPGVIISSATLAAMAYTTQSLPLSETKYIAATFGMWLFGVAGRVFLAKDLPTKSKRTR
eukprot:TRINITY_DN7454_c1_g3_i1.p1 TRINITY_DN7454_c1_g3~~TRINITY_DN7454_c1_g3_i1.p1  ORF type:complete len:146 (-),score=24.51 TRINITY_DN7454_c1_g3_i1:139-576(-)